MKKLLSVLLIIALMTSVFVGCAPKEPSVLKWNIGADPKTIDPGLNGASDGGDVINQTFEGLVREKSGVIYPGIAESWETSADGLTVTFKLRKSKWSDGSDLTANDFIYAWKRAMDPATASEYSWIWEYTNIVGAADAAFGEGSVDDVGIKAVDDYTIEIKLINPTDYIVSLLAFYHFLPVKQSSVEAGADGAWAKDPAIAVSNGPFKLTSYTIGEGLTLEKNTNYWNKKEVKIDKIEGFFIDEASTAYQAYLNGEMHFLPDVPPTETPRLIAEDPNFYVFPLLGTYYYSFNLKLDMWKDARVRTALSYAIDREAITEALASGQVPAAGFVPPGFLDADGNDFFETAGTYGVVSDDGNVAKAQELLAEAGFPGGEGFPEFVILYNTSEGHKMVAEMVQEMFKTNLGIECTLENQEWAVFQDTRKEGNFDLARGGWLTDYMDPMGLLSIFTTGNTYNDPKYSNPEFDELMANAVATRGKEHFDNLYKAQEIFMTEMPIIPVYHYTDVMLVSEKLQGWDRSVLGSVDFSGAELVD